MKQHAWNPFRGLGNSPLPWLFPLAVILLLVFLYPVFEIVRLSFTNANLVSPGYAYTLHSYLSLFALPGFGKMLWTTALFVFASAFLQMALGFLIALLVDQGTKRKLAGTVVARTAVLSAWAVPGVVIGIIWKMLYSESDSGILNYLFHLLGADHSITFLSDPTNALISVTLANVWRGTAFSMILVYAALQTFPNDLMEAAKMDGANVWQRLFRVVIPVLSPILMINLIIVTVQTFNTFDMIMALTGGGPGKSTEVIALSIYNSIFHEFELGRGAATAVVLLGINILMTIVYFRFIEKGQGGEHA